MQGKGVGRKISSILQRCEQRNKMILEQYLISPLSVHGEPRKSIWHPVGDIFSRINQLYSSKRDLMGYDLSMVQANGRTSGLGSHCSHVRQHWSDGHLLHMDKGNAKVRID